MPTNAQLLAEIDRLNQAVAESTRVPSNLPKFTGKRGEGVREWLFQVENACRINNITIEDASTRLPGIAGSAMEKPASGWFLHWSSTTRSEEHTWGIFREHVPNTSKRRTTRLSYPCTRSYVKLENPETLSDAMDLTVKYEKVSPTVVREQQKDTSAGKGSAVNNDSESSKREDTAASVVDGCSIGGKDSIVEKVFTMGVVDEIGVQTKYITRKKLKKFLKIKTKSIEEPDFMLVLSYETIKRVARTLHRQDQPASVVTAKAQRYLETDWESFQDNPVFNLLMEYKDNVFRPELPEALPEKRENEHRIDVKDPNLAMKPVGWTIVHDYRYLNSNTVRQSIPMTRKEDIVDAMAESYWLSTMDLMSAYYQVRIREEDIKFTAFQAPNGLWEYLVLPMGVCNAPATMHKLTSKIFRDLKCTKSFYDDIYIFPKSPRIEDHLDALRETLDILQYATLTAAMFALLKKKNKRNAKVHFNDELLKNFKELKRRLCNPPVLHLPDFSQTMHLRTDASKFAVGGVLFQVVNGVERPIAYISRKMKPAELNYPTQQQEHLAIVNALAAFRI
ncbi:Hypothetical protein PHPALM_17178 [Phytophthora palmivora]|uniref:Reverse transcriptase domain-containing protein n=1 Tax=Phytophthora palmivora TaxID=4796 RepID=A0A2P4XMV4_9STRA|nr:Hypothetical protein PHPALM_17178 [Phytophthora palmivora]